MFWNFALTIVEWLLTVHTVSNMRKFSVKHGWCIIVRFSWSFWGICADAFVWMRLKMHGGREADTQTGWCAWCDVVCCGSHLLCEKCVAAREVYGLGGRSHQSCHSVEPCTVLVGLHDDEVGGLTSRILSISSTLTLSYGIHHVDLCARGHNTPSVHGGDGVPNPMCDH